MLKKTYTLLAGGLLALAFAANASAALVVNTGVPAGGGSNFPYALDSMDFYAGQVNFTQASRIQSIFASLLGGSSGETFTVALYDNASNNLPGNELYSATATYGTDGWNGVSGLSGWNVNASSYWVAFEIGSNDTLGSSSITGALLPSGAPSPLARTAFSDGAGYQSSGAHPLSFGVQVDAVAAVPEPETYAMMLAGLGMLGWMARRRKTAA